MLNINHQASFPLYPSSRDSFVNRATRIFPLIVLIFAVVSLVILLGAGHGFAPAEKCVARCNGPGHGSNGASAIAVDGSGNVYVTGWNAGSGTGSDCATINY
jgi:peptidoglycan/LPS O-acetylase OafA/YrhL